MATQNEKDVAIGLARTALTAGHRVCLFGILTKHVREFEGIPRSKMHIVREEGMSHASIPQDVGIVLLCRSIPHCLVASLKSDKINYFNRIFTWRELKNILLNGCADLLVEQKKEKLSEPVVRVRETPFTEQIRSLLAQIKRDQPEVVACTDTERAFAIAFKQLAGEYDGGVVPSRKVVELIDEHKAGGIFHLVKCGWISGVVLAGKQRITAYRATPFLISAAQRTNEDGLEELEKARQLIDEKPALLAQLARITAQLEKIERIEALLDELNKAMKGA